MASTTTLPSHADWFGSDTWKDHLGGHGDKFGMNSQPETCPACATQPLLAEIHKMVFSDTTSQGTAARIAELVWSLCDGYGPDPIDQGISWDWSGIRDSSPAATKAMYDAMQAVV